jgi:hypothetical protein
MATIRLPDGTIIETSGPAEPMPEPEVEVQAEATAQPTPAAKPEPTPKPARAMATAAPIPDEPQPAGSGDFAHMGGVSNISDPDAGKPGYFNFVAPREE